MDKVQELNERAIGEGFVGWYNEVHSASFHFVGRPETAPDLTYCDGESRIHLEVAMAYYNEADAAFKWKHARGLPDAPSTMGGVNLTDKLITNISSVLAEKCLKSYGPNCILVLNVIPAVTEAERLEARLSEIAMPSRQPFEGIYLTGHFGSSSHSSGGFRCWRLDAGA